MSARPDRRAVLILVFLGVAGALVRILAGSSGAPGAVAYHAAAAPRSSLDSVAARAERLARPLRHGETVDIDRASEEEITRLPRIGPGLAARIVADREARGAFGSIEGLDRVSGIGPSVIEAVKPYATFSGGEPGRRPFRSGQPPDLPRSPLLTSLGPPDSSSAPAGELEHSRHRVPRPSSRPRARPRVP